MEFNREKQKNFFDCSFNDEHDHFPFKRQVECAGAIENLFEEYLNTDKKASLRAFLDDNITKSDVKNSDYDRKVSNLFDKFNTSLIENSLNEKYFRHQINQTKTFEILDSVENRINVFKGQILTDSIFDPVETVDNFVSFLKIQLNKLELPVLKKKVLEYFVNERENYIIEADWRANSLMGTKKPYGYKNSLITDYQLIKEATDRRILSLLKDSDFKLPVKDKYHHGLSLEEFIQMLPSSQKTKKKSSEISFIKMFRDEEDLGEITRLLVINNYCTTQSMKWEPNFSDGNQTPNKFLTALYFSLLEKGYLNKAYNNTEASNALSDYFNFKLSKKVFGDNKKAYDFQELVESYFFISTKVK